MTLVKIKTGSRIPPPEGPFRISFSGHICAFDQDTFTTLGAYVDNGLAKCVEWSKCDFFENPIWRTAAMYRTYNIPAVNFNVVN